MSPGQPLLEGSAIHEGWLRKSPPFESPNLLFRPRWRKRWMVLVQAELDAQLYILHYFTDDTKSKLKGSINLSHCMSISSNSVLETDKKSKQVHTFSLSTPERVYQFSSDNKQLVQTWIEILTNACRQNTFFEGQEGRSRSATLNQGSLLTPPRATQSLALPSSSGVQKSLKDPYIRLTECYSGNKIPPKAPPRPAKSSLDLRDKQSSESENVIGNNIHYLDLQFPSLLIQDEKGESDSTNDNSEHYKENDEVIYRNIDFVKTKAFNEMRKEVENCRYNQFGEK